MGTLLIMKKSATIAGAVVLASLVLAPTGGTPAQAVANKKPSASSADARIAKKLATRKKAKALGKDVAIRVYDPARKKTVYTSQSLEGQLPASNMKLITAANALTVIGPSTRFPTRVVRGSQAGTVVLVGGGDPLLSSSGLSTLASRTITALTNASPTHTKPTGVRLQVDATLFPTPTRAIGWQSSYGLGEISPVRALARRGVASSNTTTDATQYFIDKLKAKGVSVNYVGTVSKRAPGAELTRLSGHTVTESVRAMMPHSDNQIAETLFRQTALASGHAATWGGAGNAAKAALKKAGVPTSKLVLRDGSGLSRSDRVTAAAIVGLLRLTVDGRHPRLASLVPSLPVAGKTGTLSGRFTTSPSRCARGIVKAKTGFVNGVVALSGIARGADGKPRVFSIVANHIPSKHYSVRSTQLAVDRLAATITGCY